MKRLAWLAVVAVCVAAVDYLTRLLTDLYDQADQAVRQIGSTL